MFPLYSNLLVPEPLDHAGLQPVVPHHLRARRPRGPLPDMELHPLQIRPERISRHSGSAQGFSFLHSAVIFSSLPYAVAGCFHSVASRIASTTLAVSVMSSPLNWVNMLEPQSNMVNRIMYTKKFDSAIIQITGFFVHSQ